MQEYNITPLPEPPAHVLQLLDEVFEGLDYYDSFDEFCELEEITGSEYTSVLEAGQIVWWEENEDEVLSLFVFDLDRTGSGLGWRRA